MRRAISLCAVLAAAAFALAAAPLRVAADAGQPPVVNTWSPQSVTANGQPIHIVVVGANLSGITQVFTTPTVTPRTVGVLNDQAVVVTLPGTIDAGDYAIELTSAAGSTMPGSITVTVLAPVPSYRPLPAGQGGSGPTVSLLPAPTVEATPAPAAAAPVTAQSTPVQATAQAVSPVTDSPFFALAVGIAVGGLIYALWGKEGRLRVARNRGFLAQLWARPMQRLKLGRICLHCGRLHSIFRTRRDLWRAGQFCSATCFVASQEEELTFESSTGMAPSRLRGVGVYTDMERSLQAVLRSEAQAMGATLFSADNALNVQLVPDRPGAAAVEPGAPAAGLEAATPPAGVGAPRQP
ncbi:MAG TPA: hypothetical protein VFO60_03730 [Candidatus Dormibacteraeota bacterium]|nr:hypothetical protein [Candidatus Dormibacteraeota bacterium]